MKKEISYIPLDKIKPQKPQDKFKVSHAFLKRMKNNNDLLLDYDLLLPVEKVPNKDIYLLTDGYDKYYYMISTGRESAPCTIEKLSDSTNERLAKILRRLSNKGDSSKENKQKMLDVLSKSCKKFDDIVKKTGLTKSIIQNSYKYHNNIPREFINEHTVITTMNWIESLSVKQEVKKFLFKSAGLPIGYSKRLTHDNIKMIKKFLKQEERFNYLTSAQQIKVLSCAIAFKGEIIGCLKAMVTEYTKPYRIV